MNPFLMLLLSVSHGECGSDHMVRHTGKSHAELIECFTIGLKKIYCTVIRAKPYGLRFIRLSLINSAVICQ